MNNRLALVFALIATLLPLAAPADPPAGNLYRSLESGRPLHAAGVIRGTIASIDYASGTLVVRTPHGVVTVAVVPSTTISDGKEYSAVSDLRAGRRVQIAVSEIDGRLVAQSIVLK